MKRRRLDALLGAGIAGCAFFYFLVFAQFGYLHRLEEIGGGSSLIEAVMLSMGLGGLGGSLLAGRRFHVSRAGWWLGAGFIGCGMVGLLVLCVLDLWLQVGLAFALGLSLGVLTVSIVPVLRATLPGRGIGLWSGFAVGGGYALCNLPGIFTGSPSFHCSLGVLSCCIGAFLTACLPRLSDAGLRASDLEGKTRQRLFVTKGVWTVCLLFLALIWLDSAAFFVIQNTPSLKAISWTGSERLWLIAAMHLGFALIGGRLIDKGWIVASLILAFVLLGLGLWLLEWGVSFLGTASYVAGVSVYSTGLVAYGALAPEGKGLWKLRSRAAMVFGIGGWFGSAAGIGMARDLERVPIGFFVVAVLCLLLGLVLWRREGSSRESQEALA